MSVPVHYDFDHFHFLIQAAFDLSGIFDFQFVKGFHKPSFECFRFSPDDDVEVMQSEGCKDAEKTALNDFFSTDDTLRYDSGELSFEIKLMGLKGWIFRMPISRMAKARFSAKCVAASTDS